MRQLHVIEAKPTVVQQVFYPFGIGSLVLLIALFLLKDAFLYALVTFLLLLFLGYSSLVSARKYTLRVYDAGFQVKDVFVFYQDIYEVTCEKEEDTSDHLGEKSYRYTVILYKEGDGMQRIQLDHQRYPVKERTSFVENLQNRVKKRK